MTDLPAPLVPADVDCTDLDGFMLNVERLMASELVALASHEVVGAALFLWCRAWKQRPAASLPDDDRVLAAYARLPLPKFRRLRDEVMRGFVKCSDGRLYHKVLAAEAVRSFGWKNAARKRRDADAERLRKWRTSRGETHDEPATETTNETRFVAEGQDRTGQDSKKEGSEGLPSAADAPPPPEPVAAAAEPPKVGTDQLEIPAFLKAADPKPIDPASIVFGQGREWLMSATGKSDSQCRALLGGWRSKHGDALLIEVLGAAQRHGPIEPVAWITKAFQERTNGHQPSGKAGKLGAGAYAALAAEIFSGDGAEDASAPRDGRAEPIVVGSASLAAGKA